MVFVSEYVLTTVSLTHGVPVSTSATTAPQVDHGLPLGYHTHRRPDIGAVVEVALQQVPQTRERGVGEALDGRHRAPTGACCARFSPAAISFFKSRT